ncbi:helix-turn-helix transcriptional regulator [Isosphaeraceae bacterium EP7]
MSLAQRVRDYRYAKGWGPDELASRANISRTALYQIESGKTELPRAATVRRIARAFGIAVEVLLEHETLVGLPADDYITPFARADLDAHHATALNAESELHSKVTDLLRSPLADGLVSVVQGMHGMLVSSRPASSSNSEHG